jgi:hypothetical protein
MHEYGRQSQMSINFSMEIQKEKFTVHSLECGSPFHSLNH